MVDKLFVIGAIVELLIFYTIYVVKMIKQKKKGIKTNQMAKGQKEKKVMVVERTLSIVSWVIVVVQLISIWNQFSWLRSNARLDGILLGIAGDIVFGISVYTMRDSWRAGIPEKDQTKMVTDGIYRYSRNPAFLGFYLLYIGILLVFFNPVLLAMTLLTILVFHLQVLQEEKFLEKAFGEEYVEYRKTVFRYLGRKKRNK